MREASLTDKPGCPSRNSRWRPRRWPSSWARRWSLRRAGAPFAGPDHRRVLRGRGA